MTHDRTRTTPGSPRSITVWAAVCAATAVTIAGTSALAQSAPPQNASAPATRDAANSSANTGTIVDRRQTLAPRRRAVVRRNRWSMTLAWGGSVGVAGPLGLVGTFVEFRPWRYIGIGAGLGAGGSFGPAAGGWLSIDPISLRAVTIGVNANASTNLALVRGSIIPGRPEFPVVSGWLGVGGQVQIRPSRSLFIRLGGGYQWLLDVQRYRMGTDNELAAAGLPQFFFATPLDAVRAAARNESFGLPYAHIDFGTYWKL